LTIAQRIDRFAENGETIVQQTRSFDANNGTTFATRDKEDADDYRIFRILICHLSSEDDFIEDI
jgi:aspartyl-tRNA(Asn)/glutamyl-tRNA(Gln) amidotransferase subunit B